MLYREDELKQLLAKFEEELKEFIRKTMNEKLEEVGRILKGIDDGRK